MLLDENKVKMISVFDNLSSLRVAIIADTRVLLRGLQSGASDEQLGAIVRRIRDKEQELLHSQGVVLHPEMWRILHNRFNHRNIDFIDMDT